MDLDEKLEFVAFHIEKLPKVVPFRKIFIDNDQLFIRTSHAACKQLVSIAYRHYLTKCTTSDADKTLYAFLMNNAKLDRASLTRSILNDNQPEFSFPLRNLPEFVERTIEAFAQFNSSPFRKPRQKSSVRI